MNLDATELKLVADVLADALEASPYRSEKSEQMQQLLKKIEETHI